MGLSTFGRFAKIGHILKTFGFKNHGVANFPKCMFHPLLVQNQFTVQLHRSAFFTSLSSLLSLQEDYAGEVQEDFSITC